MRERERSTRTAGGSRICRVAKRFGWQCVVLAWLTGMAVAAADAQNRATARDSACVGDLAAQIQLSGSKVIVEDNEARPALSGLEAAGGGGAMVIAGEQRKAYQAFEKGARQGDPAAEVNLAVAGLAGWGEALGDAGQGGAALYWLSEAAKKGYPLAYFDLGVLYQNGCGVRQDYAEAARNFRLGAEAQHAPSQMNLGSLYDRGLGVARDRGEAARWYQRAAEQGLPEAAFNLGDLLAQGEGVPRDEVRARDWFERAARQGDTAAQLMLGAMYAQGRGTARDWAAAYRWTAAAALAGDRRADAQLRAIEPQLSAAELAEAQAQAREVIRQGGNRELRLAAEYANHPHH